MNIEQLEKQLDRTSEWIKATDQKVSIFLTLQGLILTFLSPSLYKLIINSYFYHDICSFIFILLCVILLILGTTISVIVVIPKLKNDNKKSFLYFRDIVSIKIEDYKKHVKEWTSEKYEEAILEQIYVLSGIVNKKQEQFIEAVSLFTLGIILLLLYFILVF